MSNRSLLILLPLTLAACGGRDGGAREPDGQPAPSATVDCNDLISATLVADVTGIVARRNIAAADLAPASGGNFSRTISVTEHGATPNDNTDDTQAIQRAIDAASRGTAIRFPRGTFRLNSTVRLKSGVALVGDGTTFDTRGNEGSALLGDGVSGVEIRGISFIGPRTPERYSRAIELRSGSSGNVIRDNSFNGYIGGGVVFRSSNGNTIRDNTFEEVNNAPPERGAHYGSIHLHRSDRNVITGNQITDFDWSGISLYGASGNRIANNRIQARAGFPRESMGIYILAGATGNLIENNEVGGARHECIVLISNNDIGHVRENVVRGNRFRDCSYAGISLQKNGSYDVTDNSIENNQVEAFAMGAEGQMDHGILLVGADNNTFVGNTIRSDGDQMLNGIRLQSNASGNVFANNRIDDVDSTGISVNAPNNRFVANVVERTPTGIHLVNAPNSVVTDAVVLSASRNSILATEGATGSEITGNQVSRPVSAGSGVTTRNNRTIGCG